MRPNEGIGVAFVQLPNPIAIESLLLDFKTCAAKKVRVKLLDRKRMASAADVNRL
jgi:hypothetical protein